MAAGSRILGRMKLITLGLLSGAIASAQVGHDYLFPIRDGRKLGFINRSGTIVVPPQYDAAGELKEGRIRVSVGNLSGYIDLSGKVVIEPKYESAGEFHDGRAIVRNGDKYALIDLSGKLIGDIPYRVLGDFHQGLLRVQTPRPTKYGYVDREGKIAIQPQFMPAGEFQDDSSNLAFGGLDREWVYFDRTGKIVIRISMGEPLHGARSFVNGRLAVKEGFTWGFKDASGKFAIPPKYNDVGDFKDGVARVQEGAKWILIDPRGKEVSPDKRKLRPIEPFSEGLALARENDLMGWIDDRDRLAFPLRKYEEAHKFSCGLARFKLDGLYGFLDRSGKIAISNVYYGASDFDHDLAFVQTKEGTAYIDTKGNMVWKSAPRPALKLK